MEKLKVYIADDHTLFRKAIVTMLQTFEGVHEVKDAENGKDLLGLIRKDPPHVALVDLKMPIMDGIETCEILLSKFPEVKIIVLTMHDSDKYILHMMELGVHAFLLKSTEPHELEKAIYAVVEKDFYHNDIVAAVMRRNMREKKSGSRPTFGNIDLSDREKEVLKLICHELTIKEIGHKLFLSENTVRNHRVNIMDKIDVKNTVGLVKYAYEIGLIS